MAKHTNPTNGNVIVERILTSDAFLTKEIKKAPMKPTNGALIADLKHLPNDLKIVIQGAREHNLKNVNLEFPRNRMVVFTGLSGSGKSSLALGVLYAEGSRRYL
ncbi:MAG TPA: excinuclease ABC subunit A, partial [Bifidobacterium sp.]|nr:excinuclease ABC subunit A [Bifidobacterium sp.]